MVVARQLSEVLTVLLREVIEKSEASGLAVEMKPTQPINAAKIILAHMPAPT